VVKGCGKDTRERGFWRSFQSYFAPVLLLSMCLCSTKAAVVRVGLKGSHIIPSSAPQWFSMVSCIQPPVPGFHTMLAWAGGLRSWRGGGVKLQPTQ